MAPRKRARTSSSSSSSSTGVLVTLSGGPNHEPKLVALWRAGRFTDVMVTVEGCSFSAHKVVLAAGSEYFEKLFKSECRDRDAPTIKDELPAAAFEPLLAFLYEGSVAVAEELITPLLHAADYLGVEPLKEAAAGALVARLAPSNAFAAWTLADDLSLPFAKRLRYDEFTVRVAERDALADPLGLLRKLRAIPPAKVAAMQAALLRARPSFLWHTDPARPSAVDA